MAGRRKKELLVIVLNIGITSDNHECRAKTVVKRLIERKIFLRPEDRIGVIVAGSNTTKNDLGVDNVEVPDYVRTPCWDEVERINQLKISKNQTTWVKALHVAMDYIGRECIGSCQKSIALIWDRNDEKDIVQQSEIQTIMSQLNEKNIRLTIVGPREINDFVYNDWTSSEKMWAMIEEKRSGQYLSFRTALSDLEFYHVRIVGVVPWKCDLEILNFTIPIASYSKISRRPVLKNWKMFSSCGDEASKKSEIVDRHRNRYKKDETVPGYLYGGQFIPVRTEDEENMKPSFGSKSYKLYSFVLKKDVGIENWACEESLRIVVPENEIAAESFYTLVKAMVKKDLVAIVRKVYNCISSPKMVALFPRIDMESEEPWCLVEMVLPFEDEKRTINERFPKSLTKELSTEQIESIDNLLKTCELREDEFLPGCIPNPSTQRKWDALACRALGEEVKYSSAQLEKLENILKMPERLKNNMKSCLLEVTNVFDCKLVEKKVEEGKNVKEHEEISRDECTVAESAEEIEILDKKELKLETNMENEALLDVDLEGMF
ncbi:X-ray repair cross-complementing protein 5-like [Prorops nasuta]|uniref:X-ray repair cross-complementing protein 5-like n=1 Tax=Prorops nasuta TaxID=863751 RepID=UPI0034CE8A18